jgi:hypothetical protein
MARTKISKIQISDDEIEDLGLKKDYHESKRSSSGYIKVSLSAWGASMLNQNMENKIEQKRRELEDLRKKHSTLEEIEERGLSKKEKKKLKKDKEKRKKEKKKLKRMPESTRLLHGAIEEYKDKYHKKKDKDKGKFSGISSKEKGGRKTELSEEEIEKRKDEKEQKEFEKKFEEPLALIRENLIDMSETLVDINDMVKETKESRSRSKHIMLKDLISAKVSLFSARATSARSMADIQRTRIDLELKKVKEKGTGGDEKTKNIAMMNKFFPQLLASGAFNSKGGKSKDDDDDDNKKDKKKKNKLKNRGEEESFEKRVSKLVKNGDIEMTPHELSIDMEGKYKVAIMKSFKTDECQVIAIDNNGKIIRDFKDKYPGLLPKKKDLDLKFDDEKDLVKCKRTDQVFQVIQVPHLY